MVHKRHLNRGHDIGKRYQVKYLFYTLKQRRDRVEVDGIFLLDGESRMALPMTKIFGPTCGIVIDDHDFMTIVE